MYYRKRGNIWYFRFTYKDNDGISHKVEKAGANTKAETQKIAMQYIHALQAGMAAGGEVTLNQFFPEWIQNGLIASGYKENTINQYASIVRNHIAPSIGNIKLKALKPKRLQEFINKLAETHSRSMVNTTISVLKKSLEYAVVYGQYIPTSPARFLHLPKRTAGVKTVDTFSKREIKTIFDKFKDSYLYSVIVIAYYTGMRVGEILALKWDDVDMYNLTIHVHATSIGTSTATIQDLPKTKSSVRTIAFTEKLKEFLECLQTSQELNRKEYAEYYKENNLVCSHPDGSPITANNVRYFNQWVKSTIGHGSIHVMRHTYATELLEHGADLELVSKQLGHSNISITAKYYSHVLDNRRELLRKAMDRAL